MRQIQLALAGILLSVTLVGCGQAGAPTGALRTLQPSSARSLAPVRQAVAPQAEKAGAIISNNSATIISNNSAAIVSNNSAGLGALDPLKAVNDPRYAAEHAEEIEKASAAEDAKNAADEAASNPPSFKVDDRTPYDVTVSARTATTMTITWRTVLPTKGLVEFGKTGAFEKSGYTASQSEDVAKTEHQLTLVKLSRYTNYTFKVSGVTALGLKFSEKQRVARTKLWGLK